MGDTCCNPSSLGAIEEAVKKEVSSTTTKVMSIRFGKSETSDFISGFIGNAFRLVNDFGCEQIVREARKEESETILLGFSQGGVFARAMVEFCGDKANVKKLITFGAPHAGVWKFPGCDRMASTASRKWCEYSRKIASKAAYSKMWKSKSVQASYFRDVSDKERFETYERSGSLLSVINGEGFFDDANTTTKSVARQDDEQRRRRRRRRRERMCNLDLFAMFSFEKDKVVVPKDSAVFSDAPSIPFEYTEEKASELLNVRETKFYLNEEDGLCLRELDGKDRMKIDVVPNANHMQFSLDWFTENIVEKYLVEKKEKEVVVVQME